MVELGRLLTAMVTPMDERGEVDWAKTRDLANRLLDSGSDGLVVGATTGEGPTLSHEEKLQTLGRGQSRDRRPGRSDCQHRQLLHMGQHQPQPGGGRESASMRCC